MGGKAFPNAQLVPLNDVQRTINWLWSELGLIEYKTLGSTGKKDFSGDIDLAVSDEQWSYQSLVAALETLLGKQNVNTHGNQFNQVYTLVESRSQPGTFYQVDFMLGDIDLLNFTHWSPMPGTSSYSGSHRTEYLKAIAKVLSHVKEHNGRVVARVGHTLHHHRGLEYSARWCAPRKDGTGYVTKMTHVGEADMERFTAEHPELEFDGAQMITDVDQIMTVLFGKPLDPNMVNTYEQIAQLIQQDEYLLANRDLIWNLYVDRLNEIGQPIPERII